MSTRVVIAERKLEAINSGMRLTRSGFCRCRPQYQTTTFTFDDANQLVSSTTDGVTTRYAYDAAGRMVREGNKTYRYGYLDKVLSVTDGDTTRTFTYHADGQLASATVGSALRADRGATPLSETETFLWDGLALIQRGDEQFMNEPHVGNAPQKLCFGGEPRAERRARRARKGPRGNPVASSKGTSYFNDALGTTVGSKSNGKYSPAALTAFGEGTDADKAFFTGKPMVEGLGHAFWMRNYRAGLAKWQTADPMGYPDGWNQLAYCGNGVTSGVDLWGCFTPDSVAVYEIKEEMNNKQREDMTKATNEKINALARELGTLRMDKKLVDGFWSVVETGLNKQYGDWEYGIFEKWRDVTWQDKEQYFEIYKMSWVFPKSSFQLWVDDMGNLLGVAGLLGLFVSGGAVVSAITVASGAIVAYNIVFNKETTIKLGYTVEATKFTRLKDMSDVEVVPINE